MILSQISSLARPSCLGRLEVPTLLGLPRHLGGSAPAQQAAQAPPTMPAFNHVPAPYIGPSAEEVLRLRKQYLSPCECV